MRKFFQSRSGYTFITMQVFPAGMLLIGLFIALTDEDNSAYLSIPIAAFIELTIGLTCAVTYYLEKRGKI